MVYKIEINSYNTQIQHLNDSWILQYRLENPNDLVTEKYVEEFTFGNFGYVVKDAITEQYVTDYVEIVDEFPTRWHEDKAVQIVQNKSGVVWGAMNQPEIAMGLAMHRKAMNMTTYEEGEKLYFYANTILPEHQAIFDAYPQLEITVNHG